MSFTEIGAVIRVLMLGSPPELEAADVLDAISGFDGVAGVHHLHLWPLPEHEAAADAHLVMETGRWTEVDAIKTEVEDMPKARFRIGHATLELESRQHACVGAEATGDS